MNPRQAGPGSFRNTFRTAPAYSYAMKNVLWLCMIWNGYGM